MSLELQPGQAVDRFVIEAVLGRGGMATVYRARHAHLHTVHAIKVLDTQGRDIHRRLLLEGRTQATLRHPNVVAVSDVVQIGQGLGLVMEYVEGPSLAAVVERGPLTLAQVGEIARGMFAGVAAAHAAGVVHRDLKPGNVLISLERGVVLPKVTDFGLAKLVDEDVAAQHTRSGATMGTPAYMAPEQVRDAKDVDHRADVFALGAILYELLTGARAFDGENVFETMQAVVAGRRLALRELRPELSTQVAAVVNMAMATDRSSRFQNVRSLATAWDVAMPPSGDDVWDAATLDSLRTLTSAQEVGDAPSVLALRRSGADRSTTTRPTAVGESGGNDTWTGPAETTGALSAVVEPTRTGRSTKVAIVVATIAAAVALWGVRSAFAPQAPGPAVPVAPSPDAVQAAPEAAPPAASPAPVDTRAATTPTTTPTPTITPTITARPGAQATPGSPRGVVDRAPRPASAAPTAATAPTSPVEVVTAPAPTPPPVLDVAPADSVAHVTVLGTHANVWLRSASGNLRAGHDPIPPGSYVVTVMFPGLPTGTRVLTLDLSAGQSVALECDETTLRCAAVPR